MSEILIFVQKLFYDKWLNKPCFDKIGIRMVLIVNQLQWVHSKIILINQKLTYANPSVMVRSSRSRDALSASVQSMMIQIRSITCMLRETMHVIKFSFPQSNVFSWRNNCTSIFCIKSRLWDHVLEVQMSLRYGFSYWPVKHQIQTKYQWSLGDKILDDKLCVPNRCYKSHMSRVTWQGNSPKLETVMKIIIDENHFCFEKSNWNKVYLSHEIIYQIKEIKIRPNEFVLFWRRNRIFHCQRNKSW